MDDDLVEQLAAMDPMIEALAKHLRSLDPADRDQTVQLIQRNLYMICDAAVAQAVALAGGGIEGGLLATRG